MGTFFALLRRGLGVAAICLLGGSLWAPLLPTVALAEDSAAAAGQPTSGKAAPAPPQRPVDPPPSSPHWTFSAEAIALGRSVGVNQALVGQLPGATTTFAQTYDQAGVEALNANQFWQRLAAGPKVGLTYRGDSGYGFELSYFSVLDLSAAKSVGPDGDWLLMTAPGTFWQTQDFPDQAMAWKDTTSLYSAEANGRLDLSPRVTMLAGLRWLRLNDRLVGWLTPADQYQPTWKKYCSDDTLDQVDQVCPGAPILAAGDNPPFWTASVTNNLYGAQVGVEATLLELGRLSLDGVAKVGVFDNAAEQTTAVSMQKQLFTAHATSNAVAFSGEAQLRASYRLGDGLALQVGYEALWLGGVALAPGQIRETETTPSSVSALGVNHGSSALFQGATLGLAYSF